MVGFRSINLLSFSFARRVVTLRMRGAPTGAQGVAPGGTPPVRAAAPRQTPESQGKHDDAHEAKSHHGDRLLRAIRDALGVRPGAGDAMDARLEEAYAAARAQFIGDAAATGMERLAGRVGEVLRDLAESRSLSAGQQNALESARRGFEAALGRALDRFRSSEKIKDGIKTLQHRVETVFAAFQDEIRAALVEGPGILPPPGPDTGRTGREPAVHDLAAAAPEFRPGKGDDSPLQELRHAFKSAFKALRRDLKDARKATEKPGKPGHDHKHGEEHHAAHNGRNELRAAFLGVLREKFAELYSSAKTADPNARGGDTPAIRAMLDVLA